MKTKQEVINFLESKVGTKVVCKGNASLNGQCVSLIKALMEFLGVPDPYKARGHANTVINAYLNEGIADPGTGFLNVFSNKNMAGGIGHIWCKANEYYESNGKIPLTVTKGKTYAFDNVCNFDKYLTEAVPTVPNMNEEQLLKDFGVKDLAELKRVWDEQKKFLEDERKKVGVLETRVREQINQLEDADKIAANLREIIKKLESNPITPPNELPVTWIPNGMAVTTEENGVKKTINYAVKQA